MMKVEMYSKVACPFCMRAKQLLQSKNVEIQVYPAAETPALFEEMLKRSNGGRTFPQIFINDRHIGGCDDLYALEAAGDLDKLLV